ncbi:hypothetical protein [Halosimplex pelagicum]|uniref:Uncharacterized protein n=1 Tax=Halosimplex pelagicum TaxID=869886 RepID=A0A7D5TS50_9EURY|nr:hypothetical protein [Halosimplex pelagicum]QLH81752.1 hypothetical protein HZS54_08980 [Halosimplex pelagicum]
MADRQRSRRWVIETAVVAAASVTAGCERWSRMRSISFQRLRIETTNGTDRVTGAVAVRSQGPDGWRTFHDVSAVAYDDEGERINATALGAIDGTTGDIEFTLTCEHHPDRIVIEAAESPCDPDTSMDVYVSVGRDDGTPIWEQRDHACEP